ncbi:hypothetical protein EG328_006839 [Venturia inaequalis]|uniref:Uncharacterized protein n=1 Tax=Venturia inaequalis TaxID=5025 RepID=A0A8H3ZFU3_VENIN|nr:hypothetical protein EG328_006839 [Venturia inaequalis]KAE9991662.1 hypothetical protein EG327_011205 [Venturia inaequalis]
MVEARGRTKTFFRKVGRLCKADLLDCWLVLHGFFMMIWLACIATSFALAISKAGRLNGFCMPDGSFNINPATYNIWKTSGYFQITLGTGHLSFALAKFIDISFDVVVGRGGQAILALVSYRVLKQYITSTMEKSPVSYGVYKTIFLGDPISLGGVSGLVQEFTLLRRLPSIIGMVWIITSALFLIVFPTFVGAMSGYSSNNHAFIRDSSGNYLDYDNLFLIDYIIFNSSRLNFTAMLSDPYLRVNSSNYSDPYYVKRPKSDQDCQYGSDSSFPLEDCYLRKAISDYVQINGFFSHNQTSSTLLSLNLTAPVLNISASYIDPGEAPSIYWNSSSGSLEFDGTLLWGSNSTDNTTKDLPFHDSTKGLYTTSSNNQTFALGDSSTQGRCQPEITYQWGFSFLLLFNFLVLLLLWSIGTYVLWLNSRLSTIPTEEPEIAGGYKAVIELASVMNHQFGKNGEDPLVLRERQIQTRIKRDLGGGRMKYRSVQREPKYFPFRGYALWEYLHRPFEVVRH